MQDGSIEQIPEDKMNEVEVIYDKNKNYLKKIKKICFDVVDSLCDGMEIKRQEFMVQNIYNFLGVIRSRR